MSKDGKLIAEDDQVYVLLEEDAKLPQLPRISGEFDDGKGMKALIEAEKSLFQNNFPQVLLAHAASSIAANYTLVVQEFDGCATPVLKGHPVSGKTTALKAVMSVFGQNHFTSESTAKFIEKKQSSTTIPFGWDDASCLKTLKACVINSFNACGSANVRGSYVPRTVPMVTTNLDCPDLKFRSRWLRIPFEELNPKLKGQEKIKAEAALRAAMEHSHKSVAIVTCQIASAINGRMEDEDFLNAMAAVEEFSEKNPLDQRAQNMFSLLLFCAHKILKAVGALEYLNEVQQKVLNLVIPSYLNIIESDVQKTNEDARSAGKANVRSFLFEHLPKAALCGNVDEVLKFLDQDFCPSSCCCGSCVAFNVQSALNFVEETLGQNYTTGITAAAVRQFIKSTGIGCVGTAIRFRGSNKQVHAAHVQQKWFSGEDLLALHEKLGVRKKKSAKKGTSVSGTSTSAENLIGSNTVMTVEAGTCSVSGTSTNNANEPLIEEILIGSNTAMTVEGTNQHSKGEKDDPTASMVSDVKGFNEEAGTCSVSGTSTNNANKPLIEEILIGSNTAMTGEGESSTIIANNGQQET